MIRVLIPCYRHENFLPEATAALQKQDCKITIASDYPRIGKGFRLNKFVPEVQEEWLTAHDADDISTENRFEVCSKYFDDHDVIYHGAYVKCGEVYRPGGWDRYRYQKESYIVASSVIVRTAIAQKVKWRISDYGQDWLWLNEISKHTNRFAYIPEPLIYYRKEFGYTKKLKFKRIRRFMLRREIAKIHAS